MGAFTELDARRAAQGATFDSQHAAGGAMTEDFAAAQAALAAQAPQAAQHAVAMQANVRAPLMPQAQAAAPAPESYATDAAGDQADEDPSGAAAAAPKRNQTNKNAKHKELGFSKAIDTVNVWRKPVGAGVLISTNVVDDFLLQADELAPLKEKVKQLEDENEDFRSKSELYDAALDENRHLQQSRLHAA